MSAGPDSTPSVCLFGAGRMGGALLRGWIGCGLSAARIAVIEPQPTAEIAAFLDGHGIRKHGVDHPDAMVFAVKPQNLEETMHGAASIAGPETVFLSLAAGRTLASIGASLPGRAAAVRSMPNLPVEVGRGITVCCANAFVTGRHRQTCNRLLGAVGDVLWIDDEDHMDAVTALSGSGPAYVFYFVECLAAAGAAAGLDPAVAMRLARTAVAGAGEMLYRSENEAQELREAVTSPNGTTAAGLSVLMGDDGIVTLAREAVAAAMRRSRELSV